MICNLLPCIHCKGDIITWHVKPSFKKTAILPYFETQEEIQITSSLNYIIRYVLVGLLAAGVILILWPELVHSPTGSAKSADKNYIISYSEAVARAAPAVVNVYASKVFQRPANPLFRDPLFQRFFGQPQQPGQGTRRDSNLGSGVLMNTDGYVLTNAHVIQGKDEINITFNNGYQTRAEVIGIDNDTDLAVLKIDLPDLPQITVGDSDQLKVGDVVLAIGNPYDFGQTVTQGIVSAKGRKRMGITTFEDFIQTDADINPGNSGGALITARGELIGINTAIVSSSGGSEGIGLATPINMALHVMEQLISKGHVVRGWLGIEAQILPPNLLQDSGIEGGGVLVAGVLNGGPADQAGIMPGDVIRNINQQNLTSPQQAIEMISGIVPGETVEIELLRGWEKIIVTARVAERPVFGR